MKKEMRTLYQELDYEEGFGTIKVSPYEQKNKQIDTCALISASDHAKRQELFGKDENLGNPMCFFNKCNLYLGDSMNWLQKKFRTCQGPGSYN